MGSSSANKRKRRIRPRPGLGAVAPHELEDIAGFPIENSPLEPSAEIFGGQVKYDGYRTIENDHADGANIDGTPNDP